MWLLSKFLSTLLVYFKDKASSICDSLQISSVPRGLLIAYFLWWIVAGRPNIFSATAQFARMRFRGRDLGLRVMVIPFTTSKSDNVIAPRNDRPAFIKYEVSRLSIATKNKTGKNKLAYFVFYLI